MSILIRLALSYGLNYVFLTTLPIPSFPVLVGLSSFMAGTIAFLPYQKPEDMRDILIFETTEALLMSYAAHLFEGELSANSWALILSLLKPL